MPHITVRGENFLAGPKFLSHGGPVRLVGTDSLVALARLDFEG